MIDRRRRLETALADLCSLPAPSGAEHELRDWVLAALPQQLDVRVDAAGNVIARVQGRSEEVVAVAAHLDEIGLMVQRVGAHGRLSPRAVSGLNPWVWGELPVEVRGRRATVAGVLSFGSRHVSAASPQHRVTHGGAPLTWADAWIETGLSAEALAHAGVEPGTRVVPAPHLRTPWRLGPDGDLIAAYGLDDKAAVAALVALAHALERPRTTVDLVFTVREELGGAGALWYASEVRPTTLLALEIVPVADEYGVELGRDPAIVAGDVLGPLDAGLVAELRDAAAAREIATGVAVLDAFGSDASAAARNGAAARAGCVGWPTQNTHGFEITSLTAIERTIDLIEAWLAAGRPAASA